MPSSQVNFRIPDALRGMLKEAADKNERSLTAEIVFRLQDSFAGPADFRIVDLATELVKLREEVRALTKAQGKKRGK